MIVVAVTVTMGIVGYSAYRTHTVRGEVAAAVAEAQTLAPLVARSFKKHREIRVDEALLAAIAHARSHPLIASVDVVDGRIDLTFGPNAHAALVGRQLSLTPYESAGLDVIWVCGNQRPGVGLEPLGFAGGARQARPLSTTIEPRHLPASCR